LVPLIDNPNSLFFSQIGLRANEERTTTNLGLGYRQYEDGWMWGVNSFYDYDITGSNSRVGVGGELWANYLKFAANGYFRVTDWHQSALHEMRDYDERPANGFDIRAEGYLPDYPQLGAFAKYEQYFGDGVSLAGTTSSGELKNNPSVSTLGLSYTPFPLITFKGQTSRGDSNDSQIGMELSYRFGVALSQQLDTDNVDLMRNLGGNRYDFVDRNYNIVMQYRKQELLRIALPPALHGEAAQTHPVTVSVLKAKYGLKSLRWSAPELLANGGEIRQTGLTTADITLPAYIFADRSGEPQGYRVTAVGEDNEGNPSNTAEMWVNVIPSVETITKLTVTPNQSLVANNRDQFTAVALLQNDKGEVLANKAVTFSVSGLKNPEGVTIYDADGNNGRTLTVISGPDGTATVKIISKSAGKASLQAKMRNGNSRTESIIYIADLSTAKIKTLELTNNKAVADGQAKNIAVATVTDQFDNQVENFPLTARADNGATVVDPNQQTDDNGQVTVRFSSETAGDSRLVVEGTGTSKSVTAQFIADISTAQIQSVTTENDGAVANGQAKNSVLVTVTDNRNNPLAGAPVTISVPGTARYQTQPVSGITDNQGRLRVDITNTKAGSEDYTFSINDSSVTRQLVFKPDESTATMTDSQLKIVDDYQKADGTAVNRVQATVLDAYGNRIPGYTVQFIADNDALPPQSQLTTDSNGETIFDLTNTKAGKTKVTAQVNGKTAFVNVTFTADSATAEILDGNMTVPVNNKPADGVTQNTVKVIVTDSKGNLVPSVSVTFSTDPAANPAGETSLTNEKGEAFFSPSSTVATDIMVTAKVNDNTMSKPVTFVPGSAVPSMSLIRTDQETYIAGSDLTVTVTLKDTLGNGISGQGALLTEQTVIVPNSAAKADAWTDKGDGEYERVYTAEKSGTNLKASLKPDSWSSAVHSSVYAITAGSVVQTTSQVITDKQSYTAGKDIKVTVTLKDTYGNSVTGQASSLTAQTVTVPNTGVKAGSDWSDRNDGSYERNYTAKNESADNKVSVKLDGWTTASESAAYSITIGGVEQSASAVRVDKNTYTAGDDIRVTVTLKDGQGNGIRGQEAALTADSVTVPNAAEKADVWTYQGDGEYERVYTAHTASSGNKVSLKLDDWSSAAESGVYAVTVGAVAQTASLIETDKNTYMAGTDIVVTVTLKDGQGNGVTGQKDVLTTDTVTVPNAGEEADSVWTDKGNGQYARVYTAQTVSAGNKASLKLSGWGSVTESAVYAVTQGGIVRANSAIKRDKETYTAGDDIRVTVTLKDGQGNGVTGQTGALTTDTVTVPNAAEKAGSIWTDKGNGEYERVYTAQTVSTGNKALLELSGWGSAAESEVYAVTQGSVVQAGSAIALNKETYTAGDDITVTVMLKDAEGNGVTGQTGVLTTDTVTVPNAAVKADVWTDKGNGEYERVYTAQTVSAGNKASLKLDGWGSAAESDVYAVTVGAVAQKASMIETDKNTYMAGTDIVVTVTLKDGQGNGVTGQKAVLTADTVTVPNTGLKTGSAWTEKGNGEYERVYIAQTASTDNKALLKLTDWNLAVESLAYAVIPGDAKPANSSLSINESRIIANNGQNEGMAIVTLLVKDGQNNPVDGLKDDLQFVVLKGSTVITEGVFIKNISATATHGQYTADVSGIDAGDYVIKVKIGSEYFGELNADITLYSYDFYIINSAVNKTIIPDQTVQYVLKAKATDNVGSEITVSNITWHSSDNTIAKFETGDTITGINPGSVTVTASGVTLNGINNADVTTKLTVSPPKESNIYGTASGTENTDLIKAPDYSLYAKTGSIVDGIGSTQGGGGDSTQNIKHLNSMKSIVTSVCTRQGNRFGGLLGQIVFNSKQNTVQTAGRNECGGGSNKDTWNVPDKAIIVGVKTWLGKGDTSEEFPGVVAIQWLYYEEE
ncbi:TPA: inverse autotransporter beta domain-containing protein, partial [Morganella morganii]|nr:inverse autotransporter beta domain-containing protein [Morganella morganii]